MAFYKLGSPIWKDLKYNQNLWNGRGGIFPFMIGAPFPSAGRLTLRESQEAVWLFGLVYVTGPGECKVVYPYESETVTKGKVHKFRNVSLYEFPFISLVASPEEKFKGWYHGDTLLSENPELEISLSSKFERVTEFEARFV